MIKQPIDLSSFQFHPVIHLPPNYEVYDFSKSYDPDRHRNSDYGVGKYNEKRPGMYDAALFNGTRTIHMGIDISAPVGTPIHAFYHGKIFLSGYNAAKGDYGYTLITHHVLHELELYVLHGHLNKHSIENKVEGQEIKQGEVIAWVGDLHENGGWNPHLHFQLSLLKPVVADMPGAVSDAELQDALNIYPDPRLVLGNLY
jgi:peptidoglycan LD-endopeptidase LytH